MNYPRIYNEFIADRRQKERLPGKKERHHVKPRCQGGSDDPSNLVHLALQDHLFAHLLLAKIHGGLLAGAFIRMLGHKKYEGRRSRMRFEALRSEAARSISEQNRKWRPNEEQRARHAASYTEERREEIGSFHSKRIADLKDQDVYVGPATGIKHSEETKKKIGEKSSINATEQWKDPEKVTAVRESNKKTWSDPDKLVEHSSLMKERLNTPAALANLSAGSEKSWADPIKRANRLAGIQAYHARRKAEKGHHP